MGQGDIVDPGTVAVAADTIIFGVGESEGVASSRDEEGGTGPCHFARLGNEVGIVDKEVELVVVGFGRYLVVEADAVGCGEGDGDADFGSLIVGKAGSGAKAERTGVGTCVGDGPRVGALCPAGGVVNSAFECF